MDFSFWIASIGIILNLIGTILLVLSLPANFRTDPNTGRLFFINGNILDILYEQVIKKSTMRIPIILLVIGSGFQILSFWLDC